MWYSKKLIPKYTIDNFGATHFDSWYGLVADYSKRTLSYSSDVLNALQGLAHALISRFGWHYSYGLWLEDLQMGLAWYIRDQHKITFDERWSSKYLVTDDGAGVEQGKDSPSCRPNSSAISKHSFLATIPSWSWARQWGSRVAFHCFTLLGGSRFETTAGVVYEPGQITGATSSQSPLCVRGLLNEAKATPSTVEWETLLSQHHFGYYLEQPSAQWAGEIADPRSDKLVGMIAYDEDPWLVPVTMVTCLLCLVHIDCYKNWFGSCLALVPVSKKKRIYRRVGFVLISDRWWFRSSQRHMDQLNDPRQRPIVRLV